MKQELEDFKRAQDLAYEAALKVQKLMCEGISEKETSDLLYTYLSDSGVKAFFHKPFAWFGDRSRYQDFKSNLQFLPTNRRLIKGDVVILDVAPILNNCVADIGYTFVFDEKPNEESLKARELLLKFRKDLPQMFMSDLSTKEIWHKVDQEIKERGFENIHKMYPFSVLAHRVRRVPFGNLPGITIPFGWQSIWSLSIRGLLPDLLGPKHTGNKKGLWAIEPHLGGSGFGAKFEEILVVDEDKDGKINAYWLSDDVPHLKPEWMKA